MSFRVDELRDLAVRLRLGSGAFGQWAAQFEGCPSDPAALVFDVDALDDYFAVLTTSWEGRRARWKSVPCNARERVGAPPLIVEGMVDAWTVDERELRARSEHIAICDRCSGEGKITCNTCSGAGNLLCTACNGQRKQYGYAANGAYRLLNCAACRGKGDVDCADCRRGIATCPVCAGERRVQRWMEIERWQRVTTAQHPSWLARRDGETAVAIDLPRAITQADLPGIAPEWLRHLTAGPAQMGERVARQQLHMTRIPRLVVHYRLGEDDQTAQFSGTSLAPLQAAPPSFIERARRLRTAWALLATTGIVATILHLSRGWFFWSSWSIGLIAALFVTLVLIHRSVAEHTATRRLTRWWLGGATASLLVTLVFAIAAQPRASHVRAEIAAGDLDDAEAELKVLGDSGVSAWADLRLARLRRGADLATARAELAAIPRNLPQFTAAAEHVDRLIVEEAQRWLTSGDYTAAAKTLETLNDRRRGRPVVDALQAEAERRTAEAKRTRDAAERLRGSRIAEEAWSALGRTGDAAADEQLVAIRTAMARDIATLEAKQRKRRGF